MKIFESRMSLLFKSNKQALCSLIFVRASSPEEAKQTHIDYITKNGYANGDIKREIWDIKECNNEKLNKKYKVKHSNNFMDWDYVKLRDLKNQENGIVMHSFNEQIYNKFIKELKN